MLPPTQSEKPHEQLFLTAIIILPYFTLANKNTTNHQGGIDESETPLSALQRECLEEIGCEVDVIGEVSKITEHRKMYQIEQISYCY